jgi:hypothetical protein
LLIAFVHLSHEHHSVYFSAEGLAGIEAAHFAITAHRISIISLFEHRQLSLVELRKRWLWVLDAYRINVLRNFIEIAAFV